MALPASGAITFNNVNVELGLSGTATISLNDAAVRALFGKASGAISMSDGYGKSSVTYYIARVSPLYSGSDAAFYGNDILPLVSCNEIILQGPPGNQTGACCCSPGYWGLMKTNLAYGSVVHFSAGGSPGRSYSPRRINYSPTVGTGTLYMFGYSNLNQPRLIEFTKSNLNMQASASHKAITTFTNGSGFNQVTNAVGPFFNEYDSSGNLYMGIFLAKPVSAGECSYNMYYPLISKYSSGGGGSHQWTRMIGNTTASSYTQVMAGDLSISLRAVNFKVKGSYAY